MTHIYIYIHSILYIIYANVSVFPIWPTNFREFLGLKQEITGSLVKRGPLEPSTVTKSPSHQGQRGQFQIGWLEVSHNTRWALGGGFPIGFHGMGIFTKPFPMNWMWPIFRRSCREIHAMHGCSWVSNILYCYPEALGKSWSNLTSIFFSWVETTNYFFFQRHHGLLVRKKHGEPVLSVWVFLFLFFLGGEG